MIEEGAPWPNDLLKTKAAYLSKDPDKTTDPLAYRVLMILPVLYRRWAALRLNDMKPWTRTWQHSAMFAGVESMGADDAWFETALNIELCKLKGVGFSGGASDIYKCFDQIPRQLLYHIAYIAGFPTGVLTAYRNYHENAVAHNSLGLGIGTPHTRQTGIPQGCPLSMMLVALLMRTWIIIMEDMHTVPRTLADDLFLFADGPGHVERIIAATEATHSYLARFGAAVAT